MCSRCNVEMTLQPRWEGSESLGWYCPCCKSVLRTIALLNADADRHAEEMGLTREEYEAHMEEQVKQIVRKPTERDMEQAQAWAERMDAEWKPVCPHDTNPWRQLNAREPDYAVFHEWCVENMPTAVELCPYKFPKSGLLEQLEATQKELVILKGEAMKRARVEEQLESLRDIAVRVSEADNQRLGAEGEPGWEAMREMEDALAALHQYVSSNPASEPEQEAK